jgi:zinc protease
VSDLLSVRKHLLDEGPTLFTQRALSSSGISVASWICECGVSLDEKGKEGLAALTARLLTAGTRSATKRELASHLDRLAATLTSETSWDGVQVEIRGPSSVEKELLSILFDVVSEPVFPIKEVEMTKGRTEEALVRERQLPASMAERTFLENLFPQSHPYHRNPIGTLRSIRSIKAPDAVAFHKRNYLWGRAKIVVTSPSKEETVVKEVTGLIPSFSSAGCPLESPSSPSSIKSQDGGFFNIAIPGTQQVEVLLGGAAPVRGDQSYSALRLANEILGGRPVLSRLFQVVREQSGLAYDADSDVEMLSQGGFWTVRAGTEKKTAEKVISLLQKEVRRLAEETVSQEELDLIRESFLGSFPLHADAPESAHSLAQEVAIFDLPEDYFLSWPFELRKITPKELRDYVSSNLGGYRAPITVVAGPTEGVRPKGRK